MQTPEVWLVLALVYWVFHVVTKGGDDSVDATPRNATEP
jgi:hypothetical protein